MNKVKNLEYNNLAKNQSLLFFIRALFAEVSHPALNETPGLWPSEEHKHGGRKVTELSFAIETRNYCSRVPTH